MNHRCRSTFLLLLGTDDVEAESSEEFSSLEFEEDVITRDISSLNALAGQVNLCSLRLIGEIGTHHFQVLINNDNTHNFIKPILAEQLGLPIQPIPTFPVYISNGDFLVCKFVCPQITLTMQGTDFILGLFVFPIEGPDVVLGVEWLPLLGRVSHDYFALSMEFYLNGLPVTLWGSLDHPSRLITLHQFHSLVRSAHVHSLFSLQLLSQSKETFQLT